MIENKINRKIYIGKTIKPNIRWTTHKSVAKGGKDKYPEKYFAIHAAMAKYGSDNFEFNVIEYYPTNEALNEAEKYWINRLKEFNVLLYNETLGGDGIAPGVKFTEEHKNNISKAKMGYKHSEEARQKMSKAKKLQFAGEKNNKAKLTENEVLEIRKLYASSKYTLQSLGEKFNITKSTAWKIVNYQLWPHIK